MYIKIKLLIPLNILCYGYSILGSASGDYPVKITSLSQSLKVIGCSIGPANSTFSKKSKYAFLSKWDGESLKIKVVPERYSAITSSRPSHTITNEFTSAKNINMSFVAFLTHSYEENVANHMRYPFLTEENQIDISEISESEIISSVVHGNRVIERIALNIYNNWNRSHPGNPMVTLIIAGFVLQKDPRQEAIVNSETSPIVTFGPEPQQPWQEDPRHEAIVDSETSPIVISGAEPQQPWYERPYVKPALAATVLAGGAAAATWWHWPSLKEHWQKFNFGQAKEHATKWFKSLFDRE